MRGLDRARDPIDLVAATVDALAGIVEHAILAVDLVDGRASTRGVVFTEDVAKIAGQQGRYTVGHGLSPLGIECGLRYLDPEWLSYQTNLLYFCSGGRQNLGERPEPFLQGSLSVSVSLAKRSFRYPNAPVLPPWNESCESQFL